MHEIHEFKNHTMKIEVTLFSFMPNEPAQRICISLQPQALWVKMP